MQKNMLAIVMAIASAALAASHAAAPTIASSDAGVGRVQIVKHNDGVPQRMNLQGYLTDSLGVPINDTLLPMVFKIYRGGSSVWSETQDSCAVLSGLFSVGLGSVTPIPFSVFEPGTACSLEVTVDGTALPKVEITSVGFAYRSIKSDTAVYAQSSAGGPPSGPAGGDLTGTYPDPTIAQKGATSGQVLKWTGSAWSPRNDSLTRPISPQIARAEIADGAINAAKISTPLNIRRNVNDHMLYLWQYNTNWSALRVRDSVGSGVGVDILGYGGGEALEVQSEGGTAIWAHSNDGEEALYGTADGDHAVRGIYRGTSSSRAGVRGEDEGTGWGLYYVGGISGSGDKCVLVRTSRGPTALYSQASPESWFEDFGESSLSGGHARVDLDPKFLETVTIDGRHPLKVFVELRDNCRGIYVKTDDSGFDVHELQSGRSNAAFCFRAVAKRRGSEDIRMRIEDIGYTDSHLYPDVNDPQIPADIRASRMKDQARAIERQTRTHQ